MKIRAVQQLEIEPRKGGQARSGFGQPAQLSLTPVPTAPQFSCGGSIRARSRVNEDDGVVSPTSDLNDIRYLIGLPGVGPA